MSVYEPLKPARNEIRLLEISPAALDNPQKQLRCRLIVHSLDDAPCYTAVSYVWGDPQDTRPIVVNNCAKEATVNLVDALTQLRELGTLSVWADALCINQQDDVEKAQQIQMMATIYGRAENVVAWIGRSDAATERAFEMIAEVARLGQQLNFNLDKCSDKSWRGFIYLEESGRKLVNAMLHNSTFQRGDVGLVLTVLQRPYWTRLWTIQELCLARSASVFCGKYSVPWHICESAIVLLSTIQSTRYMEDWNRFYESFSDLCRPFDADTCAWGGPRAAHISARLRGSGKRDLSLWTLLELTCIDTNLQATDPKDRVYAIHGLLCEEERSQVTLNPHISCADLYIQITLYLLSRYGPIVFDFCAPLYRLHNRLRLPSWASDLSCTSARFVKHLALPVPLPAPYPVQTAPSNRIVLKAARIGRIVMLTRFSGKLDDMLDIANSLEETSLLHCDPASSSDRRVGAWQALTSSRCTQADTEWLDNFVRRHAQRLSLANSTVPSCETPSRSGSPVPMQVLESEAEEEMHEYRRRFPLILANTVFVTEGGYIGFADARLSLQVGDAIYVFPQYGRPFVLRPEGEELGTRLWGLVGRALIKDLTGFELEGVRSGYHLTPFWDLKPVMEEICLC